MGVGVDVTKRKKRGFKQSGKNTLLALTSAALSLSSLDVQADIPVAEPQLNTQFGYYSEEGKRMKVQVYHGGFVAPVTDWLQLSFSHDQDTYTGASPSYVVPANSIDIVTKASGFENAGGPAFGKIFGLVNVAFQDQSLQAGINIGSLPLLPSNLIQQINSDHSSPPINPNDFF